MKVTGDMFKYGLPKITESPECALCDNKKAFVLTKKGIVCGECFLKDQTIREDAIIQEAAKIVKKRNDDRVPPLPTNTPSSE